jgi:arsenate reductase
MKEIGVDSSWEQQDIKTEKISEEQLKEMKTLSGSYESLFSRRAQKYKSLGLKEKTLTENDYKKFILEEYTFLKRPVTLLNKKIFIGNSKKVTASIIEAL